MSTLNLGLSVLLGILAVITIGIPAFIISCIIKRSDINKYLYEVAISIDELGGTLLYRTKDKTVSHMTGYYVLQGNKKAILFAKVIDALFGEGHCVKIYNEDLMGL